MDIGQTIEKRVEVKVIVKRIVEKEVVREVQMYKDPVKKIVIQDHGIGQQGRNAIPAMLQTKPALAYLNLAGIKDDTPGWSLPVQDTLQHLPRLFWLNIAEMRLGDAGTAGLTFASRP